MYLETKPKTRNWIKIENVNVNGVNVPTSQLISGKVFNIEIQKGYAFLKPDESGVNVFIPPHLVANYSLREGMEVQVETEEYICNRTKELKNRVKRIEL
jgi:cold shock CspA family protein